MSDKQITDEHVHDHVSDAGDASSSLIRGHIRLDGDQSGTGRDDVASPPTKLRPIGSFAAMPVTLHVRIPLPSFKMQSLAVLHAGSIVSTGWPSSEDLPLTAGHVRLAWAEFAIADQKRSVRITRIS